MSEPQDPLDIAAQALITACIDLRELLVDATSELRCAHIRAIATETAANFLQLAELSKTRAEQLQDR